MTIAGWAASLVGGGGAEGLSRSTVFTRVVKSWNFRMRTKSMAEWSA